MYAVTIGEIDERGCMLGIFAAANEGACML